MTVCIKSVLYTCKDMSVCRHIEVTPKSGLPYIMDNSSSEYFRFPVQLKT